MKNKTWICSIFGGGTPLYIVSAKDEKGAWELIKNELLREYPGHWHEMLRNNSGLFHLETWSSDEARIADIHELYAHHGETRKGSFKGLDEVI